MKIKEQLLKAKEAYYSGEPILSDSDFDKLEDAFRELDPHNDYFNIVGAPVETQGNKVKHQVQMKSMQKAKVLIDVEKWQNKLGITHPSMYITTPKVDGLAVTIKYNKGKLLYVATRGDGNIGLDITHIAPYVDDIKENITFTKEEIEIRGELYLPKATKYNTKGKALRNNAVGLVNRKSNKEDTHYLRCVFYGITNSNIQYESDKIDILYKEGLNTTPSFVGSSLEYVYKQDIGSLREELDFETDGIVIKINDSEMHEEINSRWEENDHHDMFALAWKPPSEGTETILREIVYQMSRAGNLIPVSVFDSITIGGANIERATVNNIDTVMALQLNIGDKLYIERANDVIPYLKSNLSKDIKRKGPAIPSHCPHCQTLLVKKGVHLHCSNKKCPEQVIQKIIYWVKESDTENIAEGTLRSLFNKGILTSIADLYNITAQDLQGIEGFQDKKIETFIEGFKQNKELTPVELLSKLNIPLVRTKALTKLNISSIIDFKEFNDESSAIGRNIIEWKLEEGNLELLDELLTIITLREPLLQQGISKGIICMTGKSDIPRKELELLINEKGYEVSTSVGKTTNILLTDDVNGGSSKLVKARKLGVEIKTYKEFFNEV